MTEKWPHRLLPVLNSRCSGALPEDISGIQTYSTDWLWHSLPEYRGSRSPSPLSEYPQRAMPALLWQMAGSLLHISAGAHLPEMSPDIFSGHRPGPSAPLDPDNSFPLLSKGYSL